MTAFSISLGFGNCLYVATGDIAIAVGPPAPAPSVAGTLSPLALTQGAAPAIIDAEAVFRNATGGTWAVTGTGATITQAGIVTVTTSVPRTASAIVVSYVKQGFVTVSAGFEVTVAAAATAPAIFGAAMWSLTDPATGNALTLGITAFPANGGSALTRVEQRIGSGAWTPLGLPSLPYNATLTGFPDGTPATVQLRAVNAVGVGQTASLSQTPTAPIAGTITTSLDLDAGILVAGQTVGSTEIYGSLATAGNYTATQGYAVSGITRAITGGVTNSTTTMIAGSTVTIAATVTAIRIGSADVVRTFAATAVVRAAPEIQAIDPTQDGQAEMTVNDGE